jgi:hypothetical protein
VKQGCPVSVLNAPEAPFHGGSDAVEMAAFQ